MLYTVQQAAIQLNVSRATVYTKIKLELFKNKIVTQQGQVMLTEELISLIHDSLRNKHNLNTNFHIDTPLGIYNDAVTIENAVDSIPDEDIVQLNKDLTNTLINQLKQKDDQLNQKDKQIEAKDNQIDEKDNQIHDLHKLIENSQVLLKEKPKQDLLQLEEHFNSLDNKLEEVKENMKQRKEQQKSIFSIFKSRR